MLVYSLDGSRQQPHTYSDSHSDSLGWLVAACPLTSTCCGELDGASPSDSVSGSSASSSPLANSQCCATNTANLNLRGAQCCCTSEELNAIVVRNAAITTNTARRGALTPPPPALIGSHRKKIRKEGSLVYICPPTTRVSIYTTRQKSKITGPTRENTHRTTRPGNTEQYGITLTARRCQDGRAV